METSEPEKKLSLLYVEDEDEPRELIGSSMASEYPDVTVYLARDGVEGLELYRKHRPDLVVTDILMPEVDGLQMSGKIKEIDPQTEIIALTAYSDTSFLLRAIEIGFSHYVLKPIDYDRLYAAIGKSLDVIGLRRLVTEQNVRIHAFASELEGKVEERTRELQESRNELALRNEKLRELTATLKAARDRYWRLYNWAPLGYLSLDDDLTIREINITGAHMLGARRSELRGTSIGKHLSPENVILVTEAFQKCMEEEHTQVELEIRIGDAKFLYVQLHCVPYLEEEEDRRLYRTALVDITRLKEAEQRLRESERLIMQQSRQAAMGELLVNISHHWRQPLNVLGLRLQEIGMLQAEGELPAAVLKEGIEKSMEILFHLSAMIDQFRSFSTSDKRKSNFKVNQVISNAVSLVAEQFKFLNIELQMETTEDVEICGSPNEYTQVLVSLFMNAKDAFQERSTSYPKISLRSWVEQGRSVVTVTDNAGGIPEDLMAKIFDPFFTTKEQGKGSGVGLFLAKSIIEQDMGGRISVRNVESGAELRIEV